MGFSYVSSSLGSEQVTETDARTVRFTLQGDASFTYTATASSVEGSPYLLRHPEGLGQE